MFSWDKDGDRVAIIKMNAELRSAQLEILSAQCATDRLRLRFSAREIARHAQRDVLRKALSSASALHRYYNDIARQVTDPESLVGPGASSSE
jgi:Leu/Phe-tRNA-protein transferase